MYAQQKNMQRIGRVVHVIVLFDILYDYESSADSVGRITERKEKGEKKN
jgi:hypothetical protein